MIALDYLAARSITIETARRYGLEFDSAPSSIQIHNRLGGELVVEGIPLSALAQEILWFPVRDPAGAFLSWIARPFPTIDGFKFLTPKGGTAPPFLALEGVPNTERDPLVIVEGPVKSLACWQAGVAAAGLNGVWCAAEKDQGAKLVLRQELAGLGLRGRKVYIGFDADALTKPGLRHAAIRLFLLLSAAGAQVYQLTSWDESEGKGIDDWLANQRNQRPGL